MFGVVALLAAVAAGARVLQPSDDDARELLDLLLPVRPPHVLRDNVSPSSVYGTDRVSTGEPLYGSVVKAVTFTYTYVFETPAASALTGTLQLAATVNNGEGLVRTIPLGGVVRFTGDHVVELRDRPALEPDERGQGVRSDGQQPDRRLLLDGDRAGR